MNAEDKQGVPPQPKPAPEPVKPAEPTWSERGDNRPLEHK
jgi:hypothetical protein